MPAGTCPLASVLFPLRRFDVSKIMKHNAVEPLETRRFCDCRRLRPRDAERLDRRGIRERIVSPNHGAPTTMTLIRADHNVGTAWEASEAGMTDKGLGKRDGQDDGPGIAVSS